MKKFIKLLNDISKSHNIAINATLSKSTANKKICYAHIERSSSELDRYNSFLRDIELLTAKTGVMLTGSINMIDLNCLADFDSYKINGNQIIASVKDFSLRYIKQIRIHKFKYDK
ncbi:hypothetical protein [Gilliamella sp. Occ4-3]|uniref:hypothetical protein n=1 Tax=Gilliamella sp. Occ4-3 TaxID=3120254 RepID=UPI00080DCF40|nr:hypothetical protein [Gilliamella apicola]OCG72970.1 hypothetical protein A9G44_09190 [Gilliamella apicola]